MWFSFAPGSPFYEASLLGFLKEMEGDPLFLRSSLSKEVEEGPLFIRNPYGNGGRPTFLGKFPKEMERPHIFLKDPLWKCMGWHFSQAFP